MKKGFLLLSVFLVLLMGLVTAQCQVTVSSQSTVEFFKEIPTIDQALGTCPVEIQPPLSQFLKNEDLAWVVNMQDGTTETAIFEINNAFLDGMTWGGTSSGFTVEISQCGLDTALSHGNDPGVYAYLYNQGEMTVSAKGLWKKLVLSVSQAFLRSQANQLQTPVTIECTQSVAAGTVPTTTVTGKPENCDDTFLPGHQGYADNQALWDGYSIGTDGVCQINTGTPTGHCVHTVQLSVSGIPYYLCWYNN